MTKVSDLVRAISETLDIPVKEVALYARRLREDHLLPQSRGRFHPPVRLKDTFRLIFAILGSGTAQDAPNIVRAYEACVEDLSDYFFRADPDRQWVDRISVDRAGHHAVVVYMEFVRHKLQDDRTDGRHYEFEQDREEHYIADQKIMKPRERGLKIIASIEWPQLQEILSRVGQPDG